MAEPYLGSLDRLEKLKQLKDKFPWTKNIFDYVEKKFLLTIILDYLTILFPILITLQPGSQIKILEPIFFTTNLLKSLTFSDDSNFEDQFRDIEINVGPIRLKVSRVEITYDEIKRQALSLYVDRSCRYGLLTIKVVN